MSQESDHVESEHTPVEGKPRRALRPESRPPLWWTIARRLIEIVVTVAVVYYGYQTARDYFANPPKTEKKQRGGPRSARLVEVEPVKPFDEALTVAVGGSVKPARTLALSAQVGGVVKSVEKRLEPGDIVRAGDVLMILDPRDHRVAVERARASLDQAKANFALESGSQRVAKAELELFEDIGGSESAESPGIDRSLILRKPQLAIAKAQIAAAKAELADARLALKRTTVKAPFDAIVDARHVDPGSAVNASTPLVTLIGTETWWVETQLPLDQIRWLKAPDRKSGEPGSVARISLPSAWGEGVFRTGELRHIRPAVESRGRLASLLVAVDDPLGLAADEAPPELVLDAWAQVELAGQTFPGAVRVARNHVYDGDTVRVMSAEGTLEIREVTVAYRGDTELIVTSNLAAGEKLVTTAIRGAKPGMKIRTEERPEDDADGKGRPGKGPGKGGNDGDRARGGQAGGKKGAR